MKISRISIRNYRNIKETSFALSATTIFMGENNPYLQRSESRI